MTVEVILAKMTCNQIKGYFDWVTYTLSEKKVQKLSLGLYLFKR